MAATEPARHALYSQLENVLGNEHAETLMTYLPEDRHDEVATKANLARVEGNIDARFDRIEERFDRIEARFDRIEDRTDRRFQAMEERMDRMQRFYVGATLGSMTGLTAIFALIVKFL